MNPQALVCIDSVGVGASAYDVCKELKFYHVMAINFAGKATNMTDRTGVLYFVNIRAFAY